MPTIGSLNVAIKANPEEPQQIATLIHPIRGKGSTHKVWVTPEKAGSKDKRILPLSQWKDSRPAGAF